MSIDNNNNNQLLITLAQAIRRGCKITPNQAYHSYFDAQNNASCVLGAALIGTMGLEAAHAYAANPVDVPAYMVIPKVCKLAVYGEIYVNHPIDQESEVRLDTLLMNLNDFNRWPRLRIVKWLETKARVTSYIYYPYRNEE